MTQIKILETILHLKKVDTIRIIFELEKENKKNNDKSLKVSKLVLNQTKIIINRLN